MGRKPGTITQVTREEKPKPTPVAMITEVRNLLAANLSVGNMDYVRALLVAYDDALATANALAVERECLETEVKDALALLNKHLTTERDSLDDALRNMLQAYISNRDVLGDIERNHPEILNPEVKPTGPGRDDRIRIGMAVSGAGCPTCDRLPPCEHMPLP